MPYLNASLASWRWITTFLLTAVLATATALSLQGAGGTGLESSFSGGSASPAAPQTNVTPALERIAAKSPDRKVEVVVQLAKGSTPKAGRTLVAEKGGVVTRNLRIINGLGAELTAADAVELARDPSVHAVSLNAKVETDDAEEDNTLLPPSLDDRVNTRRLETSFNQSIHTDKVWKMGEDPSTGKGVGVAVVDTGIAGDLEDFRVSSDNHESRVVASAVVNPDATNGDDGFGHGTHVAGLVAGNGNRREPGDGLRGDYVGAAPDTNLISVKVSDDNGDATLIDVIHGLQFVVDHKEQFNIRVVNLSLNSTEAESYKTDPLDAAVEQAWFKGIAVVVAAGNRGSDQDAVNYAPANDPYVISVGAVDDKGTKDILDDTLAEWSSRGTTQDGVSKPEFIAPGAHIVSTLAPGSDIASLCPECVERGDYFKMGGTSMSAAIVSGAVADLIEAKPSLTPDDVKAVLVETLRDVPGTGAEPTINRAVRFLNNPLRDIAPVNQGLTPNEAIDPSTGEIDFERARWSRARWSEATESLRARWSRARWSSYMCDCWDEGTDTPPEDLGDPAVEADRARWSRARWSRARWSRARWSMSFTK